LKRKYCKSLIFSKKQKLLLLSFQKKDAAASVSEAEFEKKILQNLQK
jgi:hypothetical protein